MAKLSFRPMFRHFLGYANLARWLMSAALHWCSWSIVGGIIVSIASVASEMLAFYLIVRALHMFEVTGPVLSTPATHDWLSGAPHAVLIGLPVLMLVLAGVLTYLGRSISISVYGRFSCQLADEILMLLNKHLTFYDKLSLPYGLKAIEIQQAVMNDTAACGMAVRLSMLHVISVVAMFAGLGILAVLAPALLLLWLLALLFVAPVLYWINLKALRQARVLSEVAPEYRRLLAKHVRSVVDVSLEPKSLNVMLRDRYYLMLGNRLRAIEASRLALGLIFAFAIAGFLWLAQRPAAKNILDIGYLLFLFLAFRYTYLGFQGLSVLVTTINRSLPSIIRVYDVYGRAKQLAERSNASRDVQTSNSVSVTSFSWTLLHGAREERGVFEYGKSYVLAAPGPVTIDSIGQILEMLQGKVTRSAFRVATGEQPSILTERSIAPSASVVVSEELQLLRKLLMSERPSLTDDRIDHILGSELSELEPQLRSALELGRLISRLCNEERRVLFVDGNQISLLQPGSQRLLMARLSPHLVFAISNRIDRLLTDHPYDRLLISSGQHVVLVLPGAGEIDEEMRKQGRNLFASESVAQRTGSNLNLDDHDDEAGIIA